MTRSIGGSAGRLASRARACLSGDIRAEDVLFSIGVDNLTLAGTLTSADGASESLASGRVEELFGHIRTIAPEPLVLVDLTKKTKMRFCTRHNSVDRGPTSADHYSHCHRPR